MKKILSLILCLAMLTSVIAGCAATDSPETTQATVGVDPNYDPVNNDKTLKVLGIGNSFSVDTMHFLEDIARAEGFESVALGNLYISGCKLQTHAANAAGNLPAYKFYMNYDGQWTTIEGCTLEYALKNQDWDIITMQQGSSNSGEAATYEPYLTQLIEYVNKTKTNPNARLAWNMTWAYQSDFEKSMFDHYDRDQMKMYNAIIDTVKSTVVPHTEFSYIMPVGTAIQNARTSYVGDTLTRDGYHLSELGRVIGSYTWLATFMGKPLEAINITQVSSTLILTDADKAIIMESVNAALAENFAITNSAHTEVAGGAS